MGGEGRKFLDFGREGIRVEETNTHTDRTA